MATPKESAIRFERVWLRALRFDDRPANAAPADPRREIELSLDVAVNVSDDNSQATVAITMKVSPKTEDDFESLTATLEGLFRPASDDARTQLRSFAEKQGAALLVPFMREIVANVTARTRSGASIIPPLNLYSPDAATMPAEKARP
jgi:preprotein translocase subunit SecB